MYSINQTVKASKSTLSMIAWDIYVAGLSLAGKFTEGSLRDALKEPSWTITHMGPTTYSCHVTLKHLEYGIEELLKDGLILREGN
jgi:hypothetical protein